MRCNVNGKAACISLRVLICVLCSLLMMLSTAAASDLDRLPDLTRQTSLTIQYADDGSLPDGVNFRLYYVAGFTQDVEFTPEPPFDAYRIGFRTDMSSGEWQALADTLASYVAADGLTENDSQQTVGGKAVFEPLKAGLYLVLGRSVDMDGQVFTPKPTLILLPNRQDTGWWQYDVTMVPKWDIGPIEYKELQVLKIWDDNEADDRPLKVEVELYCDGVLYEAITLSKENNWRHTWTGLDTRYEWTVVERVVPEGYTVTITEESGIAVIKNIRVYPPEDPDDPDLPQTGTDWTPVALLAGVGLLLYLAGWIRRRSCEQDEA